MSDELNELASHILADEAWFNGLADADKDELSESNHHRNQAQAGLKLARLVMRLHGTDSPP